LKILTETVAHLLKSKYETGWIICIIY